MENVSEECWVRIESLRYRIKSIGGADRGELASIDTEVIELRDFVCNACKTPPEGEAVSPGRR